MKDFNLSDWALDHRSMVWYFMIVFMVAGVFSYLSLGREEDPAFTIKTMIIQANWPGASVNETITQVTDRIEKKLEELDSLDYTRSITTPGKAVIFVNLQGDDARPRRRADLEPGPQHDERHSRRTFRTACLDRSSTTGSATSTAISTPSPPTA